MDSKLPTNYLSLDLVSRQVPQKGVPTSIVCKGGR